MKQNIDKYLFKQLFDKYYKEIMHYLYYKSANEKLAEDITQDVFFALWVKRESVSIEKVRAYLYKTATNMFITSQRRNKLEFNFKSNLETSVYSETPEFEMEFKEFNSRYQNALKMLSEKQRCVFLMRKIDRLSCKEIAESLNISVKAVEKRMKLALTNLEKMLNVKV